MHPIDRRELALHIYLIHFSLRKTAEILQVSHMTISRWISSPQRKQYIRKKPSKSTLIVETIRNAIQKDPFMTFQKLKDMILTEHNFIVSKQLIRTVIRKINFTKKKARFFW